MATNKQPMLVDNPLRAQVTIGGITCLATPGNWNAPAAGGLVFLCSGRENGACIDSIGVLTTQASTSAVNVLFYVTNQASASLIAPDNARLAAWTTVVNGAGNGLLSRVPLPPILAPVPQVLVELEVNPTEDDRKNTGLLLEAGQSVYVGVDVAITTPAASARVIVNAQGGYY